MNNGVNNSVLTNVVVLCSVCVKIYGVYGGYMVRTNGLSSLIRELFDV